MLLKLVYALLAALRGCKEMREDDILITVSRVKSAWMQAFSNVESFKDYAGDMLNAQISMLEIGVLAAKERLATLIQKIGVMKHEIQQLFDLDRMPRAVKSKMGEALRTLDATSLVRCIGWQGWLAFAVNYGKVKITTDPVVHIVCTHCQGHGCKYCGKRGHWVTTMMNYYNSKRNMHGRLCVKCGGTGYRTVRVKLKKPKVVKLNSDHYTVGGGELVHCKCGSTMTHDSGCRKCVNGWYRTKPTHGSHQHYDVITHVTKRVKCSRCKGHGASAVQNVKKFPVPFDLVDIVEMVGIMQALDHFTEGETGGVCGHSIKEKDEVYTLKKNVWMPRYGPGLIEAGDLHERMFHNLDSDVFDRENEPGGDINTNPQDRTEIKDEMDLITWEKEMPIKFGTRAPSLFSQGYRYRGKLELDYLHPWALTHTDEPTYFDNYGRGGVLQDLIADRIYRGAFAFDPEFYTYRSNEARFNYTTGKWERTKHPTHFASIYIPIDETGIGMCIRGLPKTARGATVINISITGDMVAYLMTKAKAPSPTYTIWYENWDFNYNVPVAHMQDGKWVICDHVKRVDHWSYKDGVKMPYRVQLSANLAKDGGPVPVLDHIGEITGKGLLPGHRLAVSKKREFSDGKIVYHIPVVDVNHRIVAMMAEVSVADSPEKMKVRSLSSL